jgi:hypothetical protein
MHECMQAHPHRNNNHSFIGSAMEVTSLASPPPDRPEDRNPNDTRRYRKMVPHPGPTQQTYCAEASPIRLFTHLCALCIKTDDAPDPRRRFEDPQLCHRCGASGVQVYRGCATSVPLLARFVQIMCHVGAVSNMDLSPHPSHELQNFTMSKFAWHLINAVF